MTKIISSTGSDTLAERIVDAVLAGQCGKLLPGAKNVLEEGRAALTATLCQHFGAMETPPREVTVNFQDHARDYGIGIQRFELQGAEGKDEYASPAFGIVGFPPPPEWEGGKGIVMFDSTHCGEISWENIALVSGDMQVGRVKLENVGMGMIATRPIKPLSNEPGKSVNASGNTGILVATHLNRDPAFNEKRRQHDPMTAIAALQARHKTIFKHQKDVEEILGTEIQQIPAGVYIVRHKVYKSIQL